MSTSMNHAGAAAAAPEFLYLSALSVLSPLGASAEFLAAAVRARVSTYSACPLPNDADISINFSPIPQAALGGKIPALLPGLSAPHIRLLTLAASCLQNLNLGATKMALPLLLAGPELYYEHSRLNTHFFDTLMQVAKLDIAAQHSRYYPCGRAGILYAIDGAFDYLAQNPQGAVLIGGIDTYYDAKTLGILSAGERLLGDTSIEGFVPAEGAVFFVLTSAHGPKEIIAQAQLAVARPSLGFEPGNILSLKPHPAHALAQVVGDVLAQQSQTIKYVFTSENGESYYGREFAVARLRQSEKISDRSEICRPAEFCGDTGAAYAGIALALAQVNLAESRDRALICASSDAGARAAMCVSPINLVQR